MVQASLNLIQANSGSISVKYLLEQLSIPERQFEKRFNECVGISPQFYIRVKRFNEAIRLIKGGQFTRLSDIVYALNFYDQSHFIRDIKEFTGITPKSLSQKQNDFHHEQAGYSYL
jgi:AraC-like DNA-binding protein